MKKPIHYSLALAGLLSACALPQAKQVTGVEFVPMPAPTTPEAMAKATASSHAVLTYADGGKATAPLSANILYRSGELGGGLIVDKNGKPVMLSPSVGKDKSRAKGPFFANSPDANTLLKVPGAPENTFYLVTHYEYHPEGPNAEDGKPPVNLYAQLPAVMNVATLKQDPWSGRLSVEKVANVDMSAIGGLWIPCAGSATPWNTHLGSEEYEPNAQYFETHPLEPMNLYLGTPGKTAREGGANPYRYGYPVEVKVAADGSARPVKHHAMGRIALELFQFMPDNRTAYAGDDGRDTMLLMYVADQAGDLSAGTIYGARWDQISGEKGGQAHLTWIRLGHATEREIVALIDKGIKFSDIFDAVPTAAFDKKKHADFKPVHVYPGKDDAGDKNELWHLRLKPGMEQAAAFLETRRYAAYLGATTEFTKMEGVAVNAKDKRLYVAMSYIEQGMLDQQNKERPTDHIRLTGDAKDHACGATYELTLASGQRDSQGLAIASDWAGVSMQALLIGAKKPASQTAYGKYDKCDTDMVANPDNLKFSEKLRTLFIGEDSGNHLNNFVWAYNLDSRKLARIFAAPAGAENTGLAVVEDANGHAYILSNIQHPGATEDLAKYPDEIRKDLRALIDQRGAVGYLGPLPGVK